MNIQQQVTDHINNEGLGCENQYTITLDRLATYSISKNNHPLLTKCILDRDYIRKDDKYLINKSIILHQEWNYLDKLGRKETHYSHAFNLYYDNYYVANLFTDGYRNNSKEYVKLEFVNSVFYEADWQYYYPRILDALNLNHHDLAEVEIAFDSYNVFDRLQYIVTKSNKFIKEGYDYMHLGKAFISIHNNSSTINIGSKNSSGKTIAGYNKSAHIEKYPNQQYKLAYYKALGMDVTKPIQRIELRMNNSYMCDKNIGIEDLTAPEILWSVFRTHAEEMLRFRAMKVHEAKKDKYGKLVYKTFNLINFNNIPLMPFRKPQINDTILPDLTPYKIRERFKSLLYIFIEGGAETLIETIKDFISNRKHSLVDAKLRTIANSAEVNETNRNLYRKLTKSYIKQHKVNAITAQIEQRRREIEFKIFDAPSQKTILSVSKISQLFTTSTRIELQ
ncbi:hypothetical protein [Pontibacter harenae]|uniref:hypothetical protein n=1 Tax=Pontibacter harenae TaxID=2894083 RepID=UPI001E4F10CF|nr:hypothetical protein [Pontibacter harenae]MCC9167430.1 hypothetical protein [Pontibacter harenae]